MEDIDVSDDEVALKPFIIDNSEEEEESEKEDDLMEQIRVIRPQLTKEQMDRFDKFRCTTFPKNVVKDLMKKVSKKNAQDAIVVATMGAAKVFVGELTEEALSVMDERNETGPIRPRHIREAYRKLKMANRTPYYRQKRRVFRRYK